MWKLSQSDVDTLRAMAQWFRARSGNTKNRPAVDDTEYRGSSPEVYVVRTPTDGIPALASTSGTGTGGVAVPGSADCYVYRYVEGELYQHEEYTRPVYNLSTIAISGDAWVRAIKDKHGTLYADPSGDSGETLKYDKDIYTYGSGLGSSTAFEVVEHTFGPTYGTVITWVPNNPTLDIPSAAGAVEVVAGFRAMITTSPALPATAFQVQAHASLIDVDTAPGTGTDVAGPAPIYAGGPSWHVLSGQWTGTIGYGDFSWNNTTGSLPTFNKGYTLPPLRYVPSADITVGVMWTIFVTRPDGATALASDVRFVIYSMNGTWGTSLNYRQIGTRWS